MFHSYFKLDRRRFSPQLHFSQLDSKGIMFVHHVIRMSMAAEWNNKSIYRYVEKCLVVGHYLNVNWTLGKKLHSNLNQNIFHYLKKLIWEKNRLQIGGHSTFSDTLYKWLFHQIQFDRNLFHCNSTLGHDIANQFCTWHDSTAAMPCTKFCSTPHQFIRI